MSRFAYYLISSDDPPVDAQREAFGGSFTREFEDRKVRRATRARNRPGFAELLANVHGGDTLCVYHIDRLGCDALDIQATVRTFVNLNVTIDIIGVGHIGRGIGEAVVTAIAQIAELERNKIKERCDAGRIRARNALEATGKTHRGKPSLGRSKVADPIEVLAWRKANRATILETCKQFGLSNGTVVRYCAEATRIQADGSGV